MLHQVGKLNTRNFLDTFLLTKPSFYEREFSISQYSYSTILVSRLILNIAVYLD